MRVKKRIYKKIEVFLF